MSKKNKILTAERIKEFEKKYPWTEKGPNHGKEEIRAFMNHWSSISEDTATLNYLDTLTTTYSEDLQDETELNNLEIINPKSFRIILKNIFSCSFELKKITNIDEKTASLLGKSKWCFIQLGKVEFLSRKAIKNLSPFDIIIKKDGIRLERLD
jgi:hypothetical protein